MSNGLTGDYDVVVEVGVGTVNRLLATVHQNSASQDASPKFLHSLTARIGKIPKRAKLELAEAVLSEYFSVDNFDVDRIPDDVLSNIQQNAAAAEAALTNLRRDFADAATSPVSSSSLADALTNVAAAITTVRGTADIQVGTPTLTLTTGSTMEISVHAQVRAHYAPDPGTAALPAPIHGEVRATFSAKYNPLGSTGKPAIEVKPSDDDNKIVFIPAAGTSLTASEATQIARQIQLFLRTKFKPMNAELPSDFPFKQFKSLVTGNSQAIALPLKLAGQIPAFALNSVDNLFIGSGEDFALAISRDFIGDTLQPTLNQIEQFSYTYKVTDDFFDTTVVAFHAWVSNAILDWDPGNIILIITGSAHVWGWAVSDADYDFTIKQKLTLTLDVASQAISLQAVGDPSISGLPPTYKDKAKPQIIEARDQAVANAKKLIQSALTTPRTTFNKALESFDAAANAKYVALEIGPDGVILRGSLALSSRGPVVVDFRETAVGNALTAFKSWIPGGTVENYAWSWVTKDPDQIVLPWSGTEHVVNTPHRFVFHPTKQLGPGRQRWVDLQQVCLLVEGTQIGSVSGIHGVSGGTTCSVGRPDWTATMPAWWADLMLPIWGPDPGPEDVLSNGIIAHINARSEATPSVNTGTTAVIHFATDPSAAPLPILGDALLASKLRDAEIPVIVVLPQKSFDQTRASVEARLGTFSRELRTPLTLTEDYQGNWTNAFKAPAGQATYIMSATGDLAWQHAGPLQARDLTAALDLHGSVGRRGRTRLMPPGVRPGEPAPDLFIEHGTFRERMLLPRLCGQRTMLLFWKSWSRPCLMELRRIQRIHDKASGEGPVIVAIGDGEQPEGVREIAQEHSLQLTLLSDPTSQIAKRYRVACWPTTVWIDEQGLLQRVHFGVTPGRTGTAY